MGLDPEHEPRSYNKHSFHQIAWISQYVQDIKLTNRRSVSRQARRLQLYLVHLSSTRFSDKLQGTRQPGSTTFLHALLCSRIDPSVFSNAAKTIRGLCA